MTVAAIVLSQLPAGTLAADPDQLLTRLSHVTGIRFAHL